MKKLAEIGRAPALESAGSVAATLGAFIAGLEVKRLPAAVVEKTRLCLLNGYGIALAGGNTPYAPVARRAALALHGERADGATLLGDGRRTTITGALLANGALFHGRAQEDACGACHIGAVVIPLVTALAEARKLGTSRMLLACLAGYEVAGLFELAYGTASAPRGFRSTAIYGVLGAAAASAVMLGLDPVHSAASLANAAAFAGGSLQPFADGSDEWRYQVGHFAAAGLTAAELARAGSVSAPNAFEGRAGFVRLFAGQDCDGAALTASLGQRWSILATAFKPYPVCAFNQTPVTAALALRERIAGRAIDSVRVRMNPYECGYAGMDARGPFHSVSGTLMSIPFCIAAALLKGAPSLAMMHEFDDHAVKDLVGRVLLVADAAIPILSAAIEVTLIDGGGLRQDQLMTAADYAFDRAGVAALIRRVGAETGVGEPAIAGIERFVDALPAGDLDDLKAAFADMPRA